MEQDRTHKDHTPTPEEDALAPVLRRALLQSAKAAGLGTRDKCRLAGFLGGDAGADTDAVLAELDAPVDIAGLARDVPAGEEARVYEMSVMTLYLDAPFDPDYLAALSRALRLHPIAVNAIHRRMGAPPLFV